MKHKIKDIMTKDVEVVYPDCSISSAAKQMRDLDVGFLPICEGNKLLGVITDRDIVCRILANDETDVENKTVQDAMTSPVTYCFDDQSVDEATDIMKDKQIHRLLVLDRTKKLVGVVALADLAINHGVDKLTGEVVEKISEPAAPPAP